MAVGDLVGESGRGTAAVNGYTPNPAARRYHFAEPQPVIVGPVTRRLIG